MKEKQEEKQEKRMEREVWCVKTGNLFTKRDRKEKSRGWKMRKKQEEKEEEKNERGREEARKWKH